MKIIHCADVHLGSSLTANFDNKKAKERGAELLTTFTNMFDYAENNSVNAIIIAGDLFDKDDGIKLLKKNVIRIIQSHPNISVYYIKGNHDMNGSFEEVLSNLYTFNENEWTTFSLINDNKIKITGIELNKNNKNYIYNTLNLQNEDFNIVVMHGQESAVDAKKDAEIINLKALKGKYIDYLALGHIHSYKEMPLDNNRGIYCYSGCLEGRGFDETGNHGFVLLDIDSENHTYTRKFVPFAQRIIYHEKIDISNAEDTISAVQIIKEHLNKLNYKEGSIAEIVLVGDLDVDVNIDEEYIYSQFKNDFYLLKLKDDFSIKIDYGSFEKDESLKGEFVRNVMNDSSLSEEDKAKIIKYGLDALLGKELV